jgi:energy-converting hydrogenase Eha subunit C
LVATFGGSRRYLKMAFLGTVLNGIGALLLTHAYVLLTKGYERPKTNPVTELAYLNLLANNTSVV